MNHDRKMAIIINDLDSLVHRIEALPGHPALTDAEESVQQAKRYMEKARVEIHQANLRLAYDV